TSPVGYVPTIFDRLDGAGLSWRIYGGEGTVSSGTDTGYLWTICPTFYECASTAQLDDLVPAQQALTDAARGNLTAFAIVAPTSPNSNKTTIPWPKGTTGWAKSSGPYRRHRSGRQRSSS